MVVLGARSSVADARALFSRRVAVVFGLHEEFGSVGRLLPADAATDIARSICSSFTCFTIDQIEQQQENGQGGNHAAGTLSVVPGMVTAIPALLAAWLLLSDGVC